ncbi:MAG TPA: hypothetical protein DCE42_00690, partial [Myxococcales bacterium]|nr:hypothetical protein [Myxococcales bacterium]
MPRIASTKTPQQSVFVVDFMFAGIKSRHTVLCWVGAPITYIYKHRSVFVNMLKTSSSCLLFVSLVLASGLASANADLEKKLFAKDGVYAAM